MKDAIVKLSNVSVVMNRRKIIDKLDWQVKRGENWVIIGPNGAGKTTLLKIVNGYQWPSTGKVMVLGNLFGRTDLRELRKDIGFVSSYITDWIPLDEKVLNAVISGKCASIRAWKKPEKGDVEQAQVLLRLVDCHEFQDKRFGELSEGERQKVTIARALMAKPKLLTLDEPSAGLDLKARESFLSSLKKIVRNHNATLTYVTHRIDEIPQGFTHALLLREGRSVACGAINDVLKSSNLSLCFDVKVKVKTWRGRFYVLID